MRCVVYTVVVGDYDNLLPPIVVEEGVEYVAITGSSDPAPPLPWARRPLLRTERNARMTSRWHKLHPHLLFPNHEVSLYLDGNVYLKAGVRTFIEKMSRTSPIALFRHADRVCAYEEAEVIKRYRLDDAEIVDTQMAYYRMLGFPEKLGLFTTGVQLRRHRDRALVDFVEDWWRHLKAFSHRDQLSLNFMLRRHGIEPAVIPGTTNCNDWFATGPHRLHRTQCEGSNPCGAYDEVDWLRRVMILSARSERIGYNDAAKEVSWRAMELLRTAKRYLKRLTWRRPLSDNASDGRIERS